MAVGSGKRRGWEEVLVFRDLGDRVVVEGVEVDAELFRRVVDWLDRVESRYGGDASKSVAGIVVKSLRELASHRVEWFEPYGDYEILDALAAQLRQEFEDPYFEPRPYMVVLYGPPGTGKTTWARQIGRKYLFDGGVLKGLYLEVGVGDIISKWVGVPLHTMRSVIDAVRSKDYMSVLLIDEADAIFMRPREATSGYTLEQIQLIADLKSQLTFITNQFYPTMIVLTTNYKDVIARTDEALADRIIAWVNVPPPPLSVKERILSRALSSTMKDLIKYSSPIGLLTKFRALWYTSGAFYYTTEEVAERFKRELKLRWYTPILPYDADYLVGLLSAWGWNPLDPSIKLDVGTIEAVRVWDPENPVLKVYAKVLVTIIELSRIFYGSEHRISKSFLRAYATLKRGIEDASRYWVQVYVEGLEALGKLHDGLERSNYHLVREALTILRKVRVKVDEGVDIKELHEELEDMYGNAYNAGLRNQPLIPSVLLMSIAKYITSREFMQLVNDIMSLATPITLGIRYIFGTLTFRPPRTYTSSSYTVGAGVVGLNLYNKLVVNELREGPILKPLRVMYTVRNTSEAWGKALEAVEKLPEDYRPHIKYALLPLKILHPVIHTADELGKARLLYEIVSDREALRDALWGIAEELGIQDSMIEDVVEGIFRDSEGRVRVMTTSILDVGQLYELFSNSTYQPLSRFKIDPPIMYDILMKSKELREKKKSISQNQQHR